MNMRTAIFAGFLLMVLPLVTVTACGPDFAPDVFVRKLRPDRPAEFAAGKLGLLLPTFPRTELIVAFRYLNGGSLSQTERKAYQPTYTYAEPEWSAQWDESKKEQKVASPFDKWRAKFGTNHASGSEIESERLIMRQDGGVVYRTSYLNCGQDAFRTALRTYENRVGLWGERSLWLGDWLKAQKAVFTNCTDGSLVLPEPAPAGAPILLMQDREYQTAAAYFYAANFNEAKKRFAAIQHDDGSPWRGIAGYLAARSQVRRAFLTTPGSGDVADFDPALMKQAADSLQTLLADDDPKAPTAAIQDELDLVRLRLDPAARVRELAKALAGPGTDPGFDQHLKDMTWFLDNHAVGLREDEADWELMYQEQRDSHILALTASQRSTAFNKSFEHAEDLRSSAPLVDWVLTFQSPSIEAKQHAVARWQETQSLAWLVAAITKAEATDASTHSLLAASAQVKNNSPAWESMAFHRVRLLIDLGRMEEARALLGQVLPDIRASRRESSVNAYSTLRMRAATDLDDFLTYAQQKVLIETSEARWSLSECIDVMKDPKRKYDCAKETARTQFNDDATTFLNSGAPVSVLIAAAQSGRVSPQLRQSVAMMAWARSVLLKDEDSTAKLFPLLPTRLQEQAGPGVGFRPLVAMVRNPGLRPYLEPGIQRNYSYDFVESFRDNWWCGGWNSEYEGGPVFGQVRVAFLTPKERQAGREQMKGLLAQGSALTDLGGQVLTYAKANPSDPDVPESLYLVMRMVRYGCGTWDDTPAAKSETEKQKTIVREAARLLRRHYVTSPWTEKARPFGVS